MQAKKMQRHGQRNSTSPPSGEACGSVCVWWTHLSAPPLPPRLVCLACLLSIQGWIAWTFLASQMRRGAGSTKSSEDEDPTSSDPPASPPKTGKRGKTVKRD